MKIKEIKKLYPRGTKVKLLRMNDSQAPKTGTIGIVNHVDDMGTIHVNWENGSSLGLILEEDDFIIINN